MDISELSEQEKSGLLARAMGWDIDHHEIGEDPHLDRMFYKSWLSDEYGNPIEFPCGDSTIEWSIPAFKPTWREFKFNLYDPANMALAKSVLQWANREIIRYDDDAKLLAMKFALWDNGQSDALDHILELAIKAGLVPAEEE